MLYARLSKLALILTILPQFLGAQTPSSVSLFTSPNPSVFGAAVTMTATVGPAGATGRVTFYDGVTVLGTSKLSSSTASLTFSLLPAGNRKLQARYLGDSATARSLSNVVSHTVKAAAGNTFVFPGSPPNFPAVGPDPLAIAIGDFNGDGKPDLVTANSAGGNVTVLIGKGDGSFQPARNYPAGYTPVFVAVADCNGDGYPDLVVADQEADSISILLGNGDGTFQPPSAWPVASPDSIAVGDFNGDGNVDLAVTTASGVTILLGNGDGTFQPGMPILTATYAFSIAVGDFNGDGRADLAVALYTSNAVAVLLGRGDGTFQASSYVHTGVNPRAVLVEDLNDDGRADLATANNSGASVGVALGAGDGNFQWEVEYPVDRYPTTLAVADFNGNGTLDLVAAGGIGQVNILVGNGDGTFAAGTSYGTYGGHFVIVGDFNGDGIADMAVLNAPNDSVVILLGANPVHLTATAGTPQSAPVGAAFPTALQVTVTDAANHPVAGILVTFSVPNAGPTATLLNSIAYTDASGVANVTATANSSPGSYIVIATAGVLTAPFNLTNTSLYPLATNVSPDGSGSITANPLSADGNYSPGTSVQLTSTPAAGYAFSSFSGDLTGGINPQTIVMSASHSVTANFTSVGTAPSLVSVTPNGGTGATQTFTGTYMVANGYHDLQWVQMLFATTPGDGGQPYCFVHYDVQGNGLWLYGDGGFFVGPITPGTPSNLLQNSICSVNTSASTVTGSGITLTVSAAIVFKNTAGRNIYMRAMNEAQSDTGWIQRGTWNLTAAALGTLSVSPNSGAGSTQAFTLMYADPPGFAGAAFGWVQFLVAAASDGGGQPFCFVHYDRAGNGLWLYSSDVGYFLGPIAPGTASGALNSSACSVNTAGASAANVSGSLVVTVLITMKAPMNGAKLTFQRTLDVLNRDTGWQQTGMWTIQ